MPLDFIVETKMIKLKVKSLIFKSEIGFTLMELIVVVAIMVVLATVMVINLAGQRDSRDLNIAENQLVSSIRQMQNYVLSNRLLPSGQPAQYYLIKFDLNKPNQYTLQAMYNVSSSPQYLVDVETVSLPLNIQLASSNPIVIDRSSAGLIPAVQNPGSGGCALVAFSAPFGNTYINNGCSPSNITSPYSIADSDDYKKILNYVTNSNCLSYPPPNPAICSLSTDAIITITLTNTSNTLSKTVTINGITGSVTFN